MNQKLPHTKHSTKLWGWAALGLLAMIVALASNTWLLPFVIPCLLMTGAMMWMIMGGTGRGTQGGPQT